MKRFFLFFGTVIFFLSCSKKDVTSSDASSPTATLIPNNTSPVIAFPMTVGTWWKYQRNDTTVAHDSYFFPYPTTDSSIEVITIIGKTKITDSVQAAILEVKNLTKGKQDTSYAFYYRSSFIITSKYPENINAYADPTYLYPYDFRFKLPLIDGKIISLGPYAYDSLYIKKDTTAVVLNKFFPNNIFTYEFARMNEGLAFTHIYYTCGFLSNNLGLVFWMSRYLYATHYGSSSDKWYVRRILDQYVSP